MYMYKEIPKKKCEVKASGGLLNADCARRVTGQLLQSAQGCRLQLGRPVSWLGAQLPIMQRSPTRLVRLPRWSTECRSRNLDPVRQVAQKELQDKPTQPGEQTLPLVSSSKTHKVDKGRMVKH
jgi:hypothetical protein